MAPVNAWRLENVAASDAVRTYAVVLMSLFVSIGIATISAMVCGCCGKKDDRKRLQEEADAAVPPPPSAPDSTERSQAPVVASRAPAAATERKPMIPIPADQAHKFETMALASSEVFGKAKPPGGKAPRKITSQKGTLGEAPGDTLAFAQSNVFDKPGGSVKKAPTGTVALGTLALADSNVFDKKGSGKAVAPAATMPLGTLALAKSNVFDKK